MSQAPTTSQLHTQTIDGATYEVVSNYIGDIALLDLFKQMLRRDMERSAG